MNNMRLRELKCLTQGTQLLYERRILSTVTKVMKLWRNAMVRKNGLDFRGPAFLL